MEILELLGGLGLLLLLCIAVNLDDIRTELFKLRVGDKSGDS